MEFLLTLMSMLTFYIGTPSDEITVSDSWDFRGYVDVNMDSIPEKIFIHENMYITDSFDRVMYTIPIEGNAEEIEISFAIVMKDFQEHFITGFIRYGNNEESDIVTYSIKNSKFLINDIDVEYDTYHYNGDGTVIYTGDALNYTDEDYRSGLARKNFNDLISEAARFRDEDGLNFTAIIGINNGIKNIFTFTWNNRDAYINGEIEEEFPSSWGYYLYLYSKNNIFAEIINMGPGTAEHLVPAFIVDDGKVFYPLTKYGIGQGFVYDPRRNEITASERRWGDVWEDYINGEIVYISQITVNGEETNHFHNLSTKTYWFYYDGLEFYEYGGIDMPLDYFMKLKGSDKVIEEIAVQGGEITNILYRDNGIINVNYRVESDTPEFYFYYNKSYLYDGTLILYDYNGGVYLPYLDDEWEVEVTVKYPEALPEYL
jgi:hypothetical protein